MLIPSSRHLWSFFNKRLSLFMKIVLLKNWNFLLRISVENMNKACGFVQIYKRTAERETFFVHWNTQKILTRKNNFFIWNVIPIFYIGVLLWIEILLKRVEQIRHELSCEKVLLESTLRTWVSPFKKKKSKNRFLISFIKGIYHCRVVYL